MDRRNEEKKEDTVIEDSQIPKKIGKYEIIREIGKGAMGIVYEGYDPIIKRKVAIKTARKDLSVSASIADEIFIRFSREAIMAGQIQHPNVVTIYDMGEEEGLAYIVMEYIEGEDLKSLISKKKIWSMEEIIKIANATCSALNETHKHKIVHRDIKPSNVLITKDGNIKLTDFGVARLPDSTLTQEGTLIGTPHYMSPEQFTGGKVDGKSDQFSLAVVLYELITGEKPFVGDTLNVIMHKVLRTQPLPPSDLNIRVSKELDNVIMKAMSKNPDDRYENMEEFSKALNNAINKTEKKDNVQAISDAPTLLADEGVGKKTDEELDKIRSKIRTKQKFVAIIGITLVVIGIVLGIFYSYSTGKGSVTENNVNTKINEPYFGKAIFNIWQAEDDEAYEDFQNYLDLKRISDKISPVEGTVELEIKDQAGEVVYKNDKYSTGETAQFQGKPNSISWTVRRGNDILTGELPSVVKPKEPGETVAKHILLPPIKR